MCIVKTAVLFQQNLRAYLIISFIYQQQAASASTNILLIIYVSELYQKCLVILWTTRQANSIMSLYSTVTTSSLCFASSTARFQSLYFIITISMIDVSNNPEPSAIHNPGKPSCREPSSNIRAS